MTHAPCDIMCSWTTHEKVEAFLAMCQLFRHTHVQTTGSNQAKNRVLLRAFGRWPNQKRSGPRLGVFPPVLRSIMDSTRSRGETSDVPGAGKVVLGIQSNLFFRTVLLL